MRSKFAKRVGSVQAVTDFEVDQEGRRFLQDVVQGALDLEEGRELSLAEVKQRLNLKLQHKKCRIGFERPLKRRMGGHAGGSAEGGAVPVWRGTERFAEEALKNSLECDILCDIIHGLKETRHG